MHRIDQTVNFFPINSQALEFPRPVVPVLPVVSLRKLSLTRQEHSRFFEPDVIFVRNGRTAIAQVLKLAGIGPGNIVLIPAYHCGSIIEPAMWLGATLRFYHISPDLTADLADLEAKIDGRVKAVLSCHYFGFPQPIRILRELAERHDMLLIEDCAHAFFGWADGNQLGSVGHYAITSVPKCFPAPDGGALCRNPPDHLDISQISRRSIDEVRSFYRQVQTAITYGRLPWLRPLFNFVKWLVASSHRDAETLTLSIGERERFQWFNEDDIGPRMSLASKFTMSVKCNGAIITTRRENFRFLLNATRDLRSARPLFETLPEGIVPYMFPLLLNDPERDFAILKHRHVPLWRWEELAMTDCPVSQNYRLRLVQVPCHQELRRDELSWIAGTLREVLS